MTVDAFIEYGNRARIATWQLFMRRAGDSWSMMRQQVVSSVDNLFRLTLDSTTQYDARNLTIAGTLAGDVLAIARLDPALEEGAVAGRFVASRDEADGKSRIYGGPESAPFSWTREVMPTALPTLRQIRVSVSRDDDERVLAELWAAMSLKPDILTGTRR